MTRRTVFVLVVAAFALAALSAEASFINYSTKEINLKLVYYGPKSAGLLANLEYIHGKTAPDSRGKMISLDSETERTVFFDFVPKNLGKIRGFSTRFHLYTTPDMFFDATRKLVLKGADGVVFVADADPKQSEATRASWLSLLGILDELGYDATTMPIVIQLDHSDRTGAISVDQLKKLLELSDQEVFKASSNTGAGVFDTLKAVAKRALIALKNGAAEGRKE